jgi:hypothetical protein
MTHPRALFDTGEIAVALGVSYQAVAAYHHRGEMPAPLRKYARAPVWEWRTIRPWLEARGTRDLSLMGTGNDRRPRSTDDLLTAPEAAALIGVKPLSFLRNVAGDRDGPRPDWRFGGEGAGGSTPVWHRKTIVSWIGRRPGKGWRAGA